MTIGDEIRAIADLRQRTINDKNSELTVVKEEGKAEGLAAGRDEKARETALSLLADGMPIESVSKHTKLSIEEIKKLRLFY